MNIKITNNMFTIEILNDDFNMEHLAKIMWLYNNIVMKLDLTPYNKVLFTNKIQEIIMLDPDMTVKFTNKWTDYKPLQELHSIIVSKKVNEFPNFTKNDMKIINNIYRDSLKNKLVTPFSSRTLYELQKKLKKNPTNY